MLYNNNFTPVDQKDMCGIAGLLNLDGSAVAHKAIERMTEALAHRGPDGEGVWHEGPVGIGHRRLAVIGNSQDGKQPMKSGDNRWVLSYNGEIYNYKEIRSTLMSNGISFRGLTDTEVVLAALIEWGPMALNKFNGMFALALWDRKEKRLLIARDRYGIKPIYYATNGKHFAFASEQKSLLELGLFKKELDMEALYEYFTFQNLFTNKTLLKGISLLEAGHYMIVQYGENNQSKTKFWDFHFEEDRQNLEEHEYKEELERLFKQAVSRQLVGDVELGAYLSGGIDSGAITAVASEQIRDLKSFTCGFDLSSASGIELGFDERNKAEAMSAHFKTEHYEMVLKAGDMERCLSKLCWHLEEPRIGQCYPNFYAAKLASKFVKVVLSGSGGDELFGGYPWRYYKSKGLDTPSSFIDNYYSYWQRLLNDDEIESLFSKSRASMAEVSTKEIFSKVIGNHKIGMDKPEDLINHSFYLEAKTFLHGLFIVEDKLSMAFGLESRVPFMDNDLVDFAMKCPVRLKLRDIGNRFIVDENSPGSKPDIYYSNTKDGKQILRKAMMHKIPREIAGARKQGFSSPDASWFRGESIMFVRRRLLEKESRISEILDSQTIATLVEEHLSGFKNRRLLIWSLLSVDEWLAQFF